MVNDNIVGLQDGTVRLVPHSADWAALFANERTRLERALAPYMGTIVLDIQHVGSTSIPDIPAKPIIDIAVVVTDFEQARAAIGAIRALGYTYLGENEVPGRHFFYLGEGNTTGRTHHLHMFEQSSREWRQTAGFRDYLIGHPSTAAAYGALKTELALHFAEDRPAYLEGKAEFITQVLRLSVPERPLLWTTIHDLDTGLSFSYSQDVVAQTVTLDQRRSGASRYVRLWTVDRRSLYFELTVYEDDPDLTSIMARFTAELRQQFAALTLTELPDSTIGGRPAKHLAFAWDDTQREVLYVRSDGTIIRLIYDPRWPLNLAIVETVAWLEVGDPG